MQKKALHEMRRLLLLLGGAILLCGCVRDNRDDCLFPLRLQFSYNYNREQQDLFAAEVGQVQLFLYDARSGVLRDSAVARTAELEPDNIFTWNVPPGAYYVVAWGGEGRRYRPTSCDKLSQGRMSVVARDDRTGVDHAPEHLWHRIGHDMTVTGDRQAPYPMDLHKFSNDVRVEVTGLPAESLADLSCTISASNGCYDFDGNSRSDEGRCVWLPEFSRQEDRAVHDFTVLRLLPGDDSHLHVEVLPGSGGRGVSGVIYDGSLSELLMANPGVDLDLDDEFMVRLESQLRPDGNFSVSIYVNDWHVVDMNGGLG